VSISALILGVIFWGLIETDLQEAVELFVDRAEAEAALADVLHDEPGWEGLVVVEAIEFVRICWN
jgi:hypothetical protein